MAYRAPLVWVAECVGFQDIQVYADGPPARPESHERGRYHMVSFPGYVRAQETCEAPWIRGHSE